MKAAILCSLVLSVCLVTPAFGQVEECGTMDYLKKQLRAHPQMADRIKRMQTLTESFELAAEEPVIEIPVVVHIVAPSLDAPENIMKQRVYSQIIALNEDFARDIADPETEYTLAYPRLWENVYSGDTNIRFCLAKFDPSGNVTSGITRTFTTVSQFTLEQDNIKFDATGGKDAWPRDKYLNIWVGSIAGITGYAQFPGGPAETDGVAIDYLYFGTIGELLSPYDEGHTLTHEVGHWLNLLHLWGDDSLTCESDDLVSDTPPQSEPNFGCTYSSTCGSGRDMLQNLMNYSDDACKSFFTRGQAKRMRAVLAPSGFRNPLLSSDAGCRSIVIRRPYEGFRQLDRQK